MLVYTLFFATDIVVQTIFLPDHVGGHFFLAQNIQMMEELRPNHTMPDWSTGGGTGESTVVTVATPASFSTWPTL